VPWKSRLAVACSLYHHQVPVQVGHVPPSMCIVTTVFATKYVPKYARLRRRRPLQERHMLAENNRDVAEGFSCMLYRRPMEYRGIEYAVRARLGRNEWPWTIFPKNDRAITGQFTGTRDEAIAAARRAIARWLERQTQAAGSRNART